jgi:hypothetical protein
MTKPIQIRKEDIVRDIRELASLTGQPITEAVGEAVRRELRRARFRATPSADRERKIDEVLARFHALPKIGAPLTDEELYDEDGFPR